MAPYTQNVIPNVTVATPLNFDYRRCISFIWPHVFSAYVDLSAKMGVDGALGQAAVDWASELKSSSSLDGSVQLQEGQDLRVTLNTPEDIVDIISLRWVWAFQQNKPSVSVSV